MPVLPAADPCSQLTKTLAIEDGQLEAVRQLLLGTIGGQQQRVETGVASWQLGAVGPIALDHAAQIAQPANGRAVAASEELEK